MIMIMIIISNSNNNDNNYDNNNDNTNISDNNDNGNNANNNDNDHDNNDIDNSRMTSVEVAYRQRLTSLSLPTRVRKISRCPGGCLVRSILYTIPFHSNDITCFTTKLTLPELINQHCLVPPKPRLKR